MDKIIIVCYLNIGNMDPSDLDSYVAKILDRLKNDDILHYIIPVRDQDTKIECVNPKLVSKQEYDQVKKILDRIKKSIKSL